MLTRMFFFAIPLFLSLKLQAAAPPYATTTNNQKLVAERLEALHPANAEETSILNTLAELNISATQRVLDQMSGQQYTSFFAATEITNRRFLRSLYNPLRFQISNPCSFTEEIYDLCSSKGIDAWASIAGGRSFLDGNKNAEGFRFSGYGVSFGAQKRFTPTWTFGGAGYYANDHIHHHVGGSTHMNTILGGLYALYRPAHYYALIDVTFGNAKGRLNRRINFGTRNQDYNLSSKPNISLATFYGEAGFDWIWNCLLFQPFLGLEANTFARDAKHEKGYPPLRLFFSKKETANAYSRLGFHVTTPENCYDLTFAFDFAWQYRLTSSQNHQSVKFESFGKHFTITGIPDERSSFYFGGVVWSEIFDGWTAYLGASGEVWKRVATCELTAGLLFKW